MIEIRKKSILSNMFVSVQHILIVVVIHFDLLLRWCHFHVKGFVQVFLLADTCPLEKVRDEWLETHQF